jgi:S1-C subfamily serine protease
VEYHITSAASDGVLGRQGFTVWAPKLAARAGIEVGDTILSVNGIPVDGFPSLYRIYQQVRRTPALATVQVELERGGSRVTKTYRVR